MKKEKEEWRDVPAYEGYYQVSSAGRLRSLDRMVVYSNGREQFYKGRIIVVKAGGNGYRRTTLHMCGKKKTVNIAPLVAITFLGHKPRGNDIVVDHINGVKSDDRLENLRIVTSRSNTTTCFRADKGSLTSRFSGVYWHKRDLAWVSSITYEGTQVYLGYFNSETEASKAYDKALFLINDGSFNIHDYKPMHTSSHKGVYFNKKSDKWVARITLNGKRHYIGTFPTEILAHQAYQSKLKELNKTNL